MRQVLEHHVAAVRGCEAGEQRQAAGRRDGAAQVLELTGHGIGCGIEYAAQAMAVHGALVAASAPLASSMTHEVRESIDTRAVGYLASVRNVTLHVVRLDDLDGELVASAERVTGNARSVLYEFELWSAERPLLSGRASIVIETAASAVLPGGAQP